MQFKGVFIGIDRYASPAISWLACSKRDATALHAIFTDTLGGESALLTDQDATKAEIEKHFKELELCSEDDLVVVSFSGHGTPTHELVTYNADPSDLPGSCVSIEEILKWFSKIPAKNLVLILDCCFSGGVGAKVLQVDMQSRDITSTQKIIEQLAGEGRLILTASAANEEAWETQKLGHGLLTNFLLEALQGAEEVRSAGKISIYKLLEYVTKRVSDSAAVFGKPQHPTLRGTLDGNLLWPIFSPGPLYQQAFPERSTTPATEDLQSLLAYGFPSDLIKIWSGYIPTLNQLQVDAINGFGLLKGDHLVVSAPTSSGKTMIGEMAAIKGVLERKRAFFLFPLKALVNDKYRYFTNAYTGFGIRTIRATGDSTTDEILPLLRGQYDICLLTYEKFAALVLANPHLLNQVGTIVIDEVQMITDESRGINLEFVLTLLRMRRRQGEEPQLIALSAVIGDMNGFDRWLGARLLLRTERPIPLDEGILLASGEFKYLEGGTGDEKVERYIQPEFRKGSSQDWVIPLVRKLVTEDKSVIVFRATRSEARSVALYLAETLGLPAAEKALEQLPNSDPSLASEQLRKALAGGVAFHIADLEPDERTIIEEEFRARTTLKVIVSTTTLAMGVNTPADAVVIVGLMHPGDKPYSVAEYKNIVGRAGRLGFSSRGTSILVSVNPADAHRHWERFVNGSPEDLQSQILSTGNDPKSLITRILAAAHKSAQGRGMKAEDIVEFLEESFGAFQQRQTENSWQWNSTQIVESLAVLLRHQLVEKDQDENYRLTQLGFLSGESGVSVESIVRLVDALNPLQPEEISDPVLIAATQITTELDDVLFPINKKSTQKEPQTWFGELSRQRIATSVIRALQRNIIGDSQAALRAKKAVACLLWVTEMPISQIENILTQFGGKFNGAAGPIRTLRNRMTDILPVVGRVAEVLHPGLDLGDRMGKLLVRLETGVPAPMVPLASVLGPTLSRGDYLSLFSAGLTEVDALTAASDDQILNCLERNENKLHAVREACASISANGSIAEVPTILPEYRG